MSEANKADGANETNETGAGLLERYAHVARMLYRVRFLLYAGIVVGLGFFMWVVIFPTTDAEVGGNQESRMFLPLVGVLWCVCLTLFAHGFNVDFPIATSADGWLRRLGIAMLRGVWHLLALGVVAFGIGTLMLTVRALTML